MTPSPFGNLISSGCSFTSAAADQPGGSPREQPNKSQPEPEGGTDRGTDADPWTATKFNLGVFKKLAGLGYGPLLLPIVPAGTGHPINERSKLTPAGLGKIPSVLPNGEIFGLTSYTDPGRPMTPGRLAGFHADAIGHEVTLNVGILTGVLIAIDVDGDSAEGEMVARKALAGVIAQIGERRGRQWGFLTALRAGDPDWRKVTLRYRHPLDGTLLIEILGRGQQFVALGRYKDTSRSYEWRAGTEGRTLIDTPLHQLPELPDRDALIAHIETILTAEGWMPIRQSAAPARTTSHSHSNKGRSTEVPPPAETLLAPGGVADVARLLERLPNPSHGSPGERDRDEWVKWGHRIYGATGGTADGLRQMVEWTCRWRNDPETIGKTRTFWNGIRTVHVGWRELIRQAKHENPTDPVISELWSQYVIAEMQDQFDPVSAPKTEGDTPAQSSGPVTARSDGEPDKRTSRSKTDPAIGFNDDAIALQLVRRHGASLRYVAQAGHWFLWNGKRWKTDETLAVYDLARKLCRALAAMADKVAMKTKLRAASTVAAVERLARSDPAVAMTMSQWDADPWLLNTPGGIIDLRDGKLSPHRREDHCTKMTAVAPDSTMPIHRFTAFLDEITGGDKEVQGFLQRLFGYALTGVTDEHIFAFLYGTGANGKTTLLNLIAWIMGDYAVVAPMSVFLDSGPGVERHPTDVASLRGARLAIATETEAGQYWSEAKLKQLTGGDPIAARFMRQDFFTFTPQFKLIIAGNHKPNLRNVDEAMRRRLRLVPFEVTIPPERRDLHLLEALKAEAPGILHLLVQGCLDWQRSGVQPGSRIAAASDDYMQSEDVHQAWIDERCKVGPNEHATSAELWTSWQQYCADTGLHPGNQKALMQLLADRGFSKKRQGGTGQRQRQGISVIPRDPMPLF